MTSNATGLSLLPRCKRTRDHRHTTRTRKTRSRPLSPSTHPFFSARRYDKHFSRFGAGGCGSHPTTRNAAVNHTSREFPSTYVRVRTVKLFPWKSKFRHQYLAKSSVYHVYISLHMCSRPHVVVIHEGAWVQCRVFVKPFLLSALTTGPGPRSRLPCKKMG